MRIDNLDGPAELTVWCIGSTKAVEPSRFETLQAALQEVHRVLALPGLQPWIITADGLILTPAWLEANHKRFRTPPSRSAPRRAQCSRRPGWQVNSPQTPARHRARSSRRHAPSCHG